MERGAKRGSARRRGALAALAVALLVGMGAAGRPVAAQEGPVQRLDLAAMVLDDGDLGNLARLYVEQYLTPGQLAKASGGAVSREELADAGLRWFYESRYVVRTDDETAVRLVVRSYAEEFRDAAGAEAGFALLEDEARFGLSGLVDAPAPEVGAAPREVTTGEVAAVLPAGTDPRALYDLTFRVENVVAGVAIEALDLDDLDPGQIESFARRLQERVEAVLDGQPIPGIDSSLRAALLPLSARLSTQEGYQTAADARYTTAEPDTDVFDEYESGYAMSIAVNLETAGAPSPAPYVTLALSRFEDSDGPLAVLEAATGLQSNLDDLEARPDLAVAGVDETAAFSFTSPATEAAARDSFRLLLAVGDLLVAVDVQGAASVDTARAAAVSLADQQIACLNAGGQCPAVQLPPELGANLDPGGDGTGG
jgi:hypothetical protein